jgi:zona occludens toxin (predicted ATPase)
MRKSFKIILLLGLLALALSFTIYMNLALFYTLKEGAQPEGTPTEINFRYITEENARF